MCLKVKYIRLPNCMQVKILSCKLQFSNSSPLIKNPHLIGSAVISPILIEASLYMRSISNDRKALAVQNPPPPPSLSRILVARVGGNKQLGGKNAAVFHPLVFALASYYTLREQRIKAVGALIPLRNWARPTTLFAQSATAPCVMTHV